MANSVLRKNEKDILANIKELTPENLEIIKDMFEKGFITRNIFENLQDNIKREPQIIDLCIKYINPKTLKGTLQYLTKGIGIDSVEFLKIANQYHPSLVAKYLKRNRIEIDGLAEVMETNPEIYKMLFSCDLYSKEEKSDIFSKSDKWVKDGNPIQYFNLGKNIRFNGREDYIKLINFYLHENTSTKAFCRKYKLNKVVFNEILTNISNEDKELGEQIKQTKERATQKYMAFMKDSIDKVINDEVTIRDILKVANGRINGWDFLNSMSFIDKEKTRPFLFKIVKEISKGNKEFDDKIDKKYDLPKIGGSNLDEMVNWFDSGKGQPIEDVSAAMGLIKGRLEYKASAQTSEEETLKKLSNKIVHDAHAFGGDATNIYKKELVENFTFLHPETKEGLHASNKNVQDACTIIKANNKTESKKLVRLLVKDIVCERIPDSEITEAYAKVKTSELQEKAKAEKIERSMDELRTIEDYIKYINSPAQEDKDMVKKQEGIHIFPVAGDWIFQDYALI